MCGKRLMMRKWPLLPNPIPCNQEGAYLGSFGGLCRYACPICSKSVMDMSRAWAQLDFEVSRSNFWALGVLGFGAFELLQPFSNFLNRLLDAGGAHSDAGRLPR